MLFANQQYNINSWTTIELPYENKKFDGNDITSLNSFCVLSNYYPDYVYNFSTDSIYNKSIDDINEMYQRIYGKITEQDKLIAITLYNICNRDDSIKPKYKNSICYCMYIVSQFAYDLLYIQSEYSNDKINDFILNSINSYKRYRLFEYEHHLYSIIQFNEIKLTTSNCINTDYTEIISTKISIEYQLLTEFQRRMIKNVNNNLNEYTKLVKALELNNINQIEKSSFIYINIFYNNLVEKSAAIYLLKTRADIADKTNRLKIGRAKNLHTRQWSKEYQNCIIIFVYYIQNINVLIICENEIIKRFKQEFTRILHQNDSESKGTWGREVFEIIDDKIELAKQIIIEICEKYDKA